MNRKLCIVLTALVAATFARAADIELAGKQEENRLGLTSFVSKYNNSVTALNYALTGVTALGSKLMLTNAVEAGTCYLDVIADQHDDAGDWSRLLWGAGGGVVFQTDASEQKTLATKLTVANDGKVTLAGGAILDNATSDSELNITETGVKVTGNATVTGTTTLAAALSGAVQATAGVISAGTLPVASGGTGAATLTGVLKGNGTGAVTAAALLAVADGGTGAGTITGLVKGNGTGAFTAAVAGTDYLSPAVAPNPASVVVSSTNNLDGTASVWIEVRNLAWAGMRSFADVWISDATYGKPTAQDANLTVESGDTAVLVQTVAANDHLRVLIPATGYGSLTLTTAGTGHLVVAVGGVVHSAAFTVSGP